MTKLFFRKTAEKSFSAVIARGRFLWLLVAALALPFAASLSGTALHTDQFDVFANSDLPLR